jgi:hypothetical protein
MLSPLLFFFLVSALFSLGSSSRALSFDTTWPSTTVRRSKSEIDVFLRIKSDNERRYVHNLLADTAFYDSLRIFSIHD